MDTLEFASDWLESKHISHTYDHRADVLSFMYKGIRLMVFYIREHNLYVVSHSERMLQDDLTPEEAIAILGVLQNSTYTRPVPRVDRHKIKFKVVLGEDPKDITRWLDIAVNDIISAVLYYRYYLTYDPKNIKQ